MEETAKKVKAHPLVSICIPTYNRASMLPEAIESALSMDYPNLEVVVSDNASTDNTIQIIEELNDPRIKYFRNNSNIGAFENFRKALYERAQGEYAILLGDDDYFIDNTYISRAVELLEENKNLVMVFSNWRRALLDENKSEDRLLQMETITSGESLVLNYYTKQPNGGNLLLQLYSVLFRRKLAVDIDALSLNCFDADVSIMCKIAVNGEVGFLETISVVRKIHGGNYARTAKYDVRLDNMFKVGAAVADYLKAKGLPSKSINQFKRRSYKHDLVPMINKTLYERANSQSEFNPSLWGFIKKVYRADPLLLTVFLRPRIVAQITLSTNPALYLYLKKMFGREKNVKNGLTNTP